MNARKFGAAVALLGAGVGMLSAACDDDDAECCPVSPEFTCSNFSFGGAKSLQPSGCQVGYTDNLPKVRGKKVDAKGCTYWEVDPAGGRTCGAAPIGAGVDSGGADAWIDERDAADQDALDASVDAEASTQN